MGRQTYINLPNQQRRKQYKDPSARQAGAPKASKLLSGQGEGREGKKGAMGGEGGTEVKISNSGFSQRTWLANLDDYKIVSELWTNCLSSLCLLCKMGVITEPFSLGCFKD